MFIFFIFFNDTATTEIYTLSLHDALPIFMPETAPLPKVEATRAYGAAIHLGGQTLTEALVAAQEHSARTRSEEHTSELQSRQYLVCRLLLEKKKKNKQQQLQHQHAAATHS